MSNTQSIEHFPFSCVWLIQNKGELRILKYVCATNMVHVKTAARDYEV
jgi:hypothetical protein